MLKKEMNFLELATNTKEKMISFGASSTTSIKRFDMAVKLLYQYLRENEQIFSLSVGYDWLETIPHSPSKIHDASYTVWATYKRVVHLLADNQNGNLSEWKMYKNFNVVQIQTNEYQNILECYKDYLQNNSYAPATIKRKLQEIQKLLIYFEKTQKHFCEITNKQVSDYFLTEHFKNRKPMGMRCESIEVKLFLLYAEEIGLTKNTTLHCAVPKYSISERHIVTVVDEKVQEVLLQKHPKCIADKREKATYLLALHLGLRTSDIYNLRFCDIDWETSKLHIQQKKTGVTLQLEIDVETQNALIDYILHERRPLKSPYIFVTAFGQLKRKTGHCRSLKTRLKYTDSNLHIQHDGLHILRRTFASNLLKNGVALPVISAALGQTVKESIKPYLSTDFDNMKRCALSISNFSCSRREFE